MKLVAEKVMVVGRSYKKWDDGSVTYKLQLSNGEGGTCEAKCTEELYNRIVPLDVKYDMVLNIDTSGYKNFVDVIEAYES